MQNIQQPINNMLQTCYYGTTTVLINLIQHQRPLWHWHLWSKACLVCQCRTLTRHWHICLHLINSFSFSNYYRCQRVSVVSSVNVCFCVGKDTKIDQELSQTSVSLNWSIKNTKTQSGPPYISTPRLKIKTLKPEKKTDNL